MDPRDALIWLMQEKIQELTEELGGVYRTRVFMDYYYNIPYLRIVNALCEIDIYMTQYESFRVKKHNDNLYIYICTRRVAGAYIDQPYRCRRNPGDLYWKCELPSGSRSMIMVRLHEDDFAEFSKLLMEISEFYKLGKLGKLGVHG